MNTIPQDSPKAIRAQVGDMIRIEEEVDPFFLLDEKNKRKEKTREMHTGRDNKGAHRMEVMRGTQHRPGLYDTSQMGKQNSIR